MSNQKKYIFPLLFSLALAVGIFIGGKLHFNDSPERLFSSNSNKDKINRLIDYIDYEYVDDVNTDSIVDVTVNSILEQLDPHSVYIPEEDLEKVTENMKGDFVGVGISFTMYKDTLAVIRPLEGSPAMKAGIKHGDRILTANNDTLFGKNLSNETIINTLKGAKNTLVNVKVYQKEQASIKNIKLKRGDVPIKSVAAYYMLTPNLGYIKINRFAETTYNEFKDALHQLKKQGATKLALDLRDNPGGFLGVTEQIADEFLPKGKLILFTKNKRGVIEKTYATKKGDFENRHVFVMINEKSASASEIIAGALQDNDIGTIVGRRSFGKGLVQREMKLGDGSAVRLTTSRYYTPTGRSIQRSYKNGNDDYYNDFYKRFANGELQSADSIKIADSLKFKTPKGKIVYGGGGIVPDVFVPIDASSEEESLYYMLRSGFISIFVFEYLEKDRFRFQDLSQRQFRAQIQIDDAILQEFYNYAASRKIDLAITNYADVLKRYIKATLAQQLFGFNAYEKILNENDNMIAKIVMLSNNAN